MNKPDVLFFSLFWDADRNILLERKRWLYKTQPWAGDVAGFWWIWLIRTEVDGNSQSKDH